MHRRMRQMLLGPPSLALILGQVPVHAAEDNERSAKLSYVVAEDNPIGLGVTRFAEIVAGKTGGRIKIRGFANGQLGAEVQSVSGAQGGVLEMAVVSTAGAASVVKEFRLFDLPFLFNDEREADAVLDGPIGRKILDKLKEKNLVGLCYWEYGFRQVLNSKRPVAALADIQGLKIRTIQNPVFIDTFNGLGANATPLAFTEIFSALESRAIDGAETPYNTAHSSKFYEVQKYISATNHIYGPAVVLVGKRFWDRLTQEEQTSLQEGCMEAQQYQRGVNREYDPKMLADLKARGMIFNEVPLNERARMRERTRPVIDKHSKSIGEALVAETEGELEKIRGRK